MKEGGNKGDQKLQGTKPNFETEQSIDTTQTGTRGLKRKKVNTQECAHEPRKTARPKRACTLKKRSQQKQKCDISIKVKEEQKPNLGEIKNLNSSQYSFVTDVCSDLISDIQKYIKKREQQILQILNEQISRNSCCDIVSIVTLNKIVNRYAKLYNINLLDEVNAVNILLSIKFPKTGTTLLQHFVNSASLKSDNDNNNLQYLLAVKFFVFMSCYSAHKISFSYQGSNAIIKQYKQILESKHNDFMKSPQAELFEACKQKNYSKVEEIVKLHNDHFIVDALDKNNHTQLYNACVTGDLKLIEILLSYGASWYFYSVNNGNILHAFLAFKHKVKTLKNLFAIKDYGNSIIFNLMPLPDLFGNTPLFYAILNNSFPVMRYLTALQGVSLKEIQTVNNMHALSLACIFKKLKFVKFLIKDYQGFLQIPDSNGNLPLHLATFDKNFEKKVFEEIYLNTPLELHQICNKQGFNFMHIAFKESNLDVIGGVGNKYDIEFKKIIRKVGDCGFTPLYYLNSSSKKFEKIVNFLCSKKVSFSFFDGDGLTLVHRFIMKGTSDSTLHLLSKIYEYNCEFDITLKDQNSNSALHCAIVRGNHKIVESLFKIGERNPNKIENQNIIAQQALYVLSQKMAETKKNYDLCSNVLTSRLSRQNLSTYQAVDSVPVNRQPLKEKNSLNPVFISNVGGQIARQRRHTLPYSSYSKFSVPGYMAGVPPYMYQTVGRVPPAPHPAQFPSSGASINSSSYPQNINQRYIMHHNHSSSRNTPPNIQPNTAAAFNTRSIQPLPQVYMPMRNLNTGNISIVKAPQNIGNVSYPSPNRLENANLQINTQANYQTLFTNSLLQNQDVITSPNNTVVNNSNSQLSAINLVFEVAEGEQNSLEELDTSEVDAFLDLDALPALDLNLDENDERERGL